MATECKELFARLGLNAAVAVACLEDMPKKLAKALDKRSGAREAYRNRAAKYLAKLWDTEAMPYQEKSKVTRNSQAIISAVAPDLDQPKLDFGTIYTAAVELRSKQSGSATPPSLALRAPLPQGRWRTTPKPTTRKEPCKKRDPCSWRTG